MKQVFLIGAIVVIIGVGVVYFFLQQREGEIPEVSVAVVEDIGNELGKRDLIRVTNPRPNQPISSPLLLEGEARGFWFFEASFPIRLFDGNGKEIAVAIAQAQGEWMTEEFVPFQATLEFAKPATEKGTLIFEKDNPSGLSSEADGLVMPIRF